MGPRLRGMSLHSGCCLEQTGIPQGAQAGGGGLEEVAGLGLWIGCPVPQGTLGTGLGSGGALTRWVPGLQDEAEGSRLWHQREKGIKAGRRGGPSAG